MAPLLVVEGPLLVVEELMLRTACRPTPSKFRFCKDLNKSLETPSATQVCVLLRNASCDQSLREHHGSPGFEGGC